MNTTRFENSVEDDNNIFKKDIVDMFCSIGSISSIQSPDLFRGLST